MKLFFSSEHVSRKEIAALEMNAEYFGVSKIQMMENAGSFIASEVLSRFKPTGTRVVVFAGTGGNGGDGLVAARHLASLGFKVELLLVGKPNDIKREVTRKNWESVQFMTDSIKTTLVYDSSLFPPVKGEVFIDALLGIGSRGGIKPPILHAIRVFNESKGFKIAIDVPTGVNPDSGDIFREAIKADLTITFHKIKKGLVKAKKNVGDIIVANIGIPPETETYVGPGDIIPIRETRLAESHKGDHGRLLVIGGSQTYSGAPALTAMAAMRVGVDLAYVAAPNKTAHDIASLSPNLIALKLDGDHLASRNVPFIKGFLKKSSAIVMGPGLGLHRETIEAVKDVFENLEKTKTPLLLDADGIKAFAQFKQRNDFPLVLTPHTREYEILTGQNLPKELDKKMEHVKKTANKLNAVILLKGPVDIVTNGEKIKLNKIIHNPGMTVGGTGDVLSGIVGAFLAQGFDPFKSSVAGVFINGAAGDFAVNEYGYHILPTDLIKWIPKIIDDPMSHIQVRKL